MSNRLYRREVPPNTRRRPIGQQPAESGVAEVGVRHARQHLPKRRHRPRHPRMDPRLHRLHQPNRQCRPGHPLRPALHLRQRRPPDPGQRPHRSPDRHRHHRHATVLRHPRVRVRRRRQPHQPHQPASQRRRQLRHHQHHRHHHNQPRPTTPPTASPQAPTQVQGQPAATPTTLSDEPRQSPPETPETEARACTDAGRPACCRGSPAMQGYAGGAPAPELR